MSKVIQKSADKVGRAIGTHFSVRTLISRKEAEEVLPVPHLEDGIAVGREPVRLVVGGSMNVWRTSFEVREGPDALVVETQWSALNPK